METIVICIIIIYACSLFFIFSYSLIQLNLVFHYLKNKSSLPEKIIPHRLVTSYPKVTVQLPVYNEMYVVERLIDEVSKLNYPRERLEIQVLDDSDDETTELISEKISALLLTGVDISHIRRDGRNGFKAGALAYGLEIAKGEFIAIFDSDFMPKKNFLIETMAAFNDPSVGVVQTRWEHLNKNYSLITRLQAFGLDAHFTIEQSGRNAAGHFINFNGTAGVWRKKCIEDAGGWTADTLTEDLDLSYRAQIKGWKFIFLERTGTPAELPVAMNALKNQQFRWNKGAAECVKKNLGSVLKKKDLGWSTKLHAVFHLMNSTVFIFIMATAILSIPMLFIKEHFIQFREIFLYASFFLISLLILGVFYFTSMAQQDKKFPRNLGKFGWIFPLFLSVSMGLSLHNAVAVIQGYFGKRTAFKRTPKFGMQSANPSWKENRYLEKNINWMTVAEGILCVYFASGILIAFKLKDYGLLPFHILLAFGFGFVCYLSVVHSNPRISSSINNRALKMARG